LRTETIPHPPVLVLFWFFEPLFLPSSLEGPTSTVLDEMNATNVVEKMSFLRPKHLKLSGAERNSGFRTSPLGNGRNRQPFSAEVFRKVSHG
jgi:hypothetical protein